MATDKKAAQTAAAAETAAETVAETVAEVVPETVTETVTETVIEEPAKPDPRELVQLYVTPATRPNEEKYAMVWVNGKSWSMRKGFTHTVPRYVADEYHRALNAQARALERHENRRQQELAHNAEMAQKIGSTNAM